jgi:hypothetical protein
MMDGIIYLAIAARALVTTFASQNVKAAAKALAKAWTDCKQLSGHHATERAIHLTTYYNRALQSSLRLLF